MAIRLEKIILARHYGFCMGVKRAIKIAEETGRMEPGPVSVINEIVHNDAVVRQLTEDGVGTVLSVADAPDGTVIISAHGAPPAWFAEAEKRGLKVIDATCPLVIRIHKIVHRLIDNGYQIIHYGDPNHDETKGVVGQAPDGRVTVVHAIEQLHSLPANGRRFALTSQTTATSPTSSASAKRPPVSCRVSRYSIPSATPPASGRRRCWIWRPKST